MYVGMLSL